VMSVRVNENSFERATRELRAFAAVASPYLVRLFDAGQEANVFYYAMEYLPLGSLAAPARPLTPTETLRAVEHAARAVHALHEAGRAHRDIKPANVLLHDDGAKLSDLGLSQILRPGVTVTKMNDTSSYEYVDPLVLKGASVSRASDIWSLGVTLQRALTGRGLYGELSDRDSGLLWRTLVSVEPVVDQALEPDIREIVARCVDMDPVRRPGTAEEVADALAEAIAGRPVPV
jgi:serine/threonine protein kinase